jgi:hypothetical protein
MARRYDPLGPIAPQQQRRLALQYVNALVNPVMRQIEAQFNRQLAGGAGLIRGYTNQLQSSLAPLAGQTQQRYTTADQSLAQIDNALSNKLTAAGQSGQGELAKQLTAAGIPLNAAPDIASMGAGAGAAGFAKGSAARQALVQQGAAATDYAASLPAIAGLQGGQTLRSYGAQLANQRQTAMENLRGRIPGLAQQIGTQLSNLDFQRAAARIGFVGDQAKLAQQSGYENARLGLQQRQQNLSHADRQAALAARRAASSGKSVKARQSAVSKATTQARQILDAATRPVAIGSPTPTAGAPGSLIPPSAGGTPKTRQANYYGTLKRVVGVIRPLLSPYMTNARIIQFAQAIANSYYAPGQYGRPGRGTPAGAGPRGPQPGTGPR